MTQVCIRRRSEHQGLQLCRVTTADWGNSYICQYSIYMYCKYAKRRALGCPYHHVDHDEQNDSSEASK